MKTLTTGKIKLPIRFDNGDVEYIYINPRDKEMQKKINNFEASMNERFEKINIEKYQGALSSEIDASKLNFRDLLEMGEDEINEIADKVKTINEFDEELEKEVKEEIDNIFNSDVSSKAFKYVSPLELVPTDEDSDETELYVVAFLDCLAEEIQAYNEKMSKSSNKYIEKYASGKK